MTPKQNSLYWRLWADVCQAKGWLVPRITRAQMDAHRHAEHIKALGYDKSHLEFTNKDFDLIIAHFKSISEPENLTAQVDAIQQPRTRLLYSINQFDPPLWRKIARDKFGHSDLKYLTSAQLTQLLITLQQRAKSRVSQTSKSAVSR